MKNQSNQNPNIPNNQESSNNKRTRRPKAKYNKLFSDFKQNNGEQSYSTLLDMLKNQSDAMVQLQQQYAQLSSKTASRQQINGLEKSLGQKTMRKLAKDTGEDFDKMNQNEKIQRLVVAVADDLPNFIGGIKTTASKAINFIKSMKPGAINKILDVALDVLSSGGPLAAAKIIGKHFLETHSETFDGGKIIAINDNDKAGLYDYPILKSAGKESNRVSVDFIINCICPELCKENLTSIPQAPIKQQANLGYQYQRYLGTNASGHSDTKLFPSFFLNAGAGTYPTGWTTCYGQSCKDAAYDPVLDYQLAAPTLFGTPIPNPGNVVTDNIVYAVAIIIDCVSAELNVTGDANLAISRGPPNSTYSAGPAFQGLTAMEANDVYLSASLTSLCQEPLRAVSFLSNADEITSSLTRWGNSTNPSLSPFHIDTRIIGGPTSSNSVLRQQEFTAAVYKPGADQENFVVTKKTVHSPKTFDFLQVLMERFPQVMYLSSTEARALVTEITRSGSSDFDELFNVVFLGSKNFKDKSHRLRKMGNKPSMNNVNSDMSFDMD